MGLALENFDAVGQFPYDGSPGGHMRQSTRVLYFPSGLPLNGPAELPTISQAIRPKFALAFTEKLMMYAVNRQRNISICRRYGRSSPQRG
jgi:hypothetical protein